MSGDSHGFGSNSNCMTDPISQSLELRVTELTASYDAILCVIIHQYVTIMKIPNANRFCKAQIVGWIRTLTRWHSHKGFDFAPRHTLENEALFADRDSTRCQRNESSSYANGQHQSCQRKHRSLAWLHIYSQLIRRFSAMAARCIRSSTAERGDLLSYSTQYTCSTIGMSMLRFLDAS